MKLKQTYLLVAAVSLFGCGGNSEKTSETSNTPPPQSMVEDAIVVPDDVQAALTQNTCLTCHRVDSRLVGPPYVEIANKVNNAEEIIGLIREPKQEHWPDYPSMTGINISDEDGNLIANWILSLKKG